MERPPSRNWAIETQGLTRSFGNNLVLAGIDLAVKPGESIVIFGANGVGKTTLIKLLANILHPSSGQVILNGLNIKNNAEETNK